MWDSNSFQLIATLTGHSKTIDFLKVFANGNLVSRSLDHNIKVWDSVKLELIANLSDTGSIKLSILPNGNIISKSQDKTMWCQLNSNHSFFLTIKWIIIIFGFLFFIYLLYNF